MKKITELFYRFAFKPSLILVALLITFPFNIVSASFVGGEIIVGFNDGVTEVEADAFVKSFGLTWESKFPELFGIFVDYKPEILGDQGFELRNRMADRITEEDRKLAQKPYANYLVLNTRVVNDKVLIMFNNRATEEQAKEFISQFDGLKFVSFNRASSYGVVKVPNGEEQKWVDAFQKASIVRYAELNQTVTLSSSGDSSSSSAATYLIGIIVIIVGAVSFYSFRKRRSR